MSRPIYRVGDAAPSPLPQRSEAAVMAHWRGDKPVVSIKCTTFEHVGFIEDALQGFLGQDTDFPFEILVRDDASTDGTAEIVRDYADRYPSIIRAVLESENRWPDVKPDSVLSPMVRGEFIALCEGDDYWTDPTKLSRQVAQLRGFPSAVVSHHQSIVVEHAHVVSLERLAAHECVNHDMESLRRGGRLLTNTLLFRNVPLPLNPYRGRYPVGIKFLRVALGFVGDAVFLKDIGPSVYRRHPGGISSGARDTAAALDVASTHYLLAEFLAGHADCPAAAVHARKSMESLSRGISLMSPSSEPIGHVAPRQGATPWLSRLSTRALRFLRG